MTVPTRNPLPLIGLLKSWHGGHGMFTRSVDRFVFFLRARPQAGARM